MKNTSNLLALVNLPPSSGFGTMLRNIGEIRNSGVEIGVGIIPVNNSNFFWQIDANIAFNRNKVMTLAKGNKFLAPGMGNLGSIHLIAEGEPLSVFYGFEEAGIDENGNYKYVDHKPDGIITDEDRVILGSPYPDFIYGINSSLNYKNIEVNLSFQGVYGNSIYNYANGFSAASLAKGYNQIVDVSDNYWTKDNKYPEYEYPKLNTAGYDRPSERFIEDGSFLRLSNLQIGYNFKLPENRINLNEFMIYFSGRNLLTITNYSGYDPEVNRFGSSDLRTGVDYYTYPVARVYTIGLRLKL
jgi:hypothetical protein